MRWTLSGVRGGWRPLVRFAIEQSSGKWRIIDNGRSASHNWSLETDERIHTTSVDMGVATLRRLRELLGPFSSSRVPVSTTQDMKRAFRQLGVRDEDRSLHIVALWHPARAQWLFGELDGLAFGLGAAVLEFNRVPAHLVAFARRWFAIPVLNFYDDFRITDFADIVGSLDVELFSSANETFEDVMKFIGWLLDPDKKQGPARRVRFLGVIEDATDAAEDDDVKLRTDEDRRLKLKLEIDEAISTKKCPSRAMCSIVGKLMHVAESYPGRLGRGMISSLTSHVAGSVAELDGAALHALHFQSFLLSTPRYKSIPLGKAAFPPSVVISDASWNDLDHLQLHGRVCFLAFVPHMGLRVGGVMDIPYGSKLVSLLEQRKTQIQAAETLGPLLALWFANRILASTAATFFVDNISGMCCLNKGGSRKRDLSAVNLGVTLGLCRYDIRPWWDYVESASNVSDGGSRVGLQDLDAPKLGVKLLNITDFSFPEDFPGSSPRQWDEWWHRADEASVHFISASVA